MVDAVAETLGLGNKWPGMEKMPPIDPKTGKMVTGKTKIIRITDKGKKALKKGDHKLSITAKGKAAIKDEVEIDELSTELLGKYKTKAAAQSSAASKAGYHKLAHKRYKGVNTATTLQFRNDAKKYDERQKKKNEEVDVDAFDYKAKKGAIAAPGSGSIAKPRKPKASDVNKSIEQQMADARKEEVTMEDMKWKVSLTGLPQFYMDGKSAAEVKLTLRKMLKRPDDILDIERTQLAKVRKDFRMRGQGKTEPENNSE